MIGRRKFMITNSTKKPRELLVKGKWWQRLLKLCPSNPDKRGHCKHWERTPYKDTTRHGNGDSSVYTTRTASYEKCCWCNREWWDDNTIREKCTPSDGY